jgi:hypothetical protein
MQQDKEQVMRKTRTVSREARRHAYMRAFKKNISFYDTHKRELLKKYRNKHIAILNKQVIDVDEDQRALFRRLLESVGDGEPFFVTEVLEKPRTVRLPSVKIIAKEALL